MAQGGTTLYKADRQNINYNLFAVEKTKNKIRSFLYNHLKDRIQFKIRFIN